MSKVEHGEQLDANVNDAQVDRQSIPHFEGITTQSIGITVYVKLLGAVTFYQCRELHAKVSDFWKTKNFQDSFTNGLSRWGLDMSAIDFEQQPSLEPAVDENTTVGQWTAKKSGGIICFFLKSGYPLEEIMKSIKNESEQSDMAVRQNRAKYLRQRERVWAKLSADTEELSANEVVQLFSQKLDNSLKEIRDEHAKREEDYKIERAKREEDYKIERAKRDEQFAKRHEQFAKSNQEIDALIRDHKTQMNGMINEFAAPIRQLRVLILLEMYRDYLKNKYNVNFHDTVSETLQNLIDTKQADEMDTNLIPLVKNTPNSLYSTISSQFMHAPVDITQMALTVTNEPDVTTRQSLLQIFRLVYGKDAENLTGSLSSLSLPLAL